MIRKNTSVIKKSIRPKGFILNDNDTGVDYLGHTVYAKALAETVVHVKTPVTIGVFARWGSGKSFLIKHVCNILQRYQQQGDRSLWTETKENSAKGCNHIAVALTLVVAALVIGAAIVMNIPAIYQSLDHIQSPHVNETGIGSPTDANETATVKPAATTAAFEGSTGLSLRQVLSITALAISVGLTLMLLAAIFWFRRGGTATWPSVKLLCIAAFAKLPVDSMERAIVRGDYCEVEMEFDDAKLNGNEPTSDRKARNTESRPKRYIFAHFNAWAYAGSDNLWAGIVTNLADAIEAEFGFMTSRLFRLLDVETVSRDLAADDRRCCVFLKLRRDPRNDASLNELLRDLGVVSRVESYKDWFMRNRMNRNLCAGADFENWWAVEYTCGYMARGAAAHLSKENVAVQLDDPFAHITRARTFRDATQHMALLPIGPQQESRGNGDVLESEDRYVKPDGFCTLFKRHPKTALKVPVLYLALFLASSLYLLYGL